MEPDYKVFVNDFIPNDERYRDQWHLPKVSAPAAWDISTGLPDVSLPPILAPDGCNACSLPCALFYCPHPPPLSQLSRVIRSVQTLAGH